MGLETHGENALNLSWSGLTQEIDIALKTFPARIRSMCNDLNLLWAEVGCTCNLTALVDGHKAESGGTGTEPGSGWDKGERGAEWNRAA